ncbi:MAG: hypothetical protein DRI57_27465 [Deltaproteobacteria bacterium]|nr:MAG: hypothetical protein DRI57_27465 [Deltaproteobacteria bacterium]
MVDSLFTLTVKDIDHLNKILTAIRSIKQIQKAVRISN